MRKVRIISGEDSEAEISNWWKDYVDDVFEYVKDSTVDGVDGYVVRHTALRYVDVWVDKKNCELREDRTTAYERAMIIVGWN